MTVKRSRKRCLDCPKECFCGSTRRLENNHVAGRKHVGGLWLPFCGDDHDQFHKNCERANVDFQKQSNSMMRCLQAVKALLVGLWMVVGELEKHTKAQMEDKGNDRNP